MLMNENYFVLDPIKKQTVTRKLIDDLSEIDTQDTPASEADNEMLSLIIDEVRMGIDISVRYPTFYRKLLNNASLRRTFMDVLESIEEKEYFSLPEFSRPSLAFLSNQKPKSIVERFGKNQWRVTLHRSIEQLQAIFSPPELAYRSDPSLYEDPWLTLLRGEIEVAGCLYTILLECTLAEEIENALALSLNIAVTLEATPGLPQSPLTATLQWGSYDESLPISIDGRTRFPYVSLPAILDDEQEKIKADLNLILERSS
jgi:hypothetical protein